MISYVFMCKIKNLLQLFIEQLYGPLFVHLTNYNEY